METLGERIRRRREELDLSQGDLANLIREAWPNADKGELSKLELDQRPEVIKYSQRLAAIARALQMDLTELITGLKKTPPR